jgi:hypothetical protein
MFYLTINYSLQMKRRNFIFLSALTAATVTLPLINCKRSDDDFDKKLALPEMLSQICDEKTIREIGMAYGNAHPDKYNLSMLEKLLRKDMDGTTISSSTETAKIVTILKSKVQADYNMGNTVVEKGWVIAEQEVLQCALFSLLYKTKI